MEYPSAEIQDIYERACAYLGQGDTYNAVKLFKRITKLAPDWVAPYRQLATIYKARREWKPAFHYSKRSVALNSTDRQAWWDVGLTATALRKRRVAARVWAKFGLAEPAHPGQHPISVQLSYQQQFEILLASRLDPARAVIESIPFPASGFRYQDTILIEGEQRGSHIAGVRRMPVFGCLDLLKQSRFRTFACRLQTGSAEEVDILGQLCQEAGLGFENWSNTNRVLINDRPGVPVEYYGRRPADQEPDGGVLVAIAAQRKPQVQEVLHTWEVISLRSASPPEQLL